MVANDIKKAMVKDMKLNQEDTLMMVMIEHKTQMIYSNRIISPYSLLTEKAMMLHRIRWGENRFILYFSRLYKH